MRFQFDANQEYQLRAIESVVNLLKGQPPIEVELQFASGTGFAAVANRLDLTEAALLDNVRAVQNANALEPDADLKCLEDEIGTGEGRKPVRFPNFSIEMETGTGKTYVYLRTIIELYQRYGLRKYIVVVPSIAIREGVLKTLRVTESHFRDLYGNPPYRFYTYDSANLSQIRQFALSDGIEIMIMTIDSFNKASNVIRQSTDRLQGETPLYLVQATRPILVLDEPQNMESQLSRGSLATLDPLFALRYSATHRNPYNLVYRLTPAEAYRQGLVKRIEVAGVEEENNPNRAYIRLESVKAEKRTLIARLAVHALSADGTVREQLVIVRPGDSLESRTRRPEYAPFVVDEINAGEGFVSFANGVELALGESRGADKEAIFQAQIGYTIEEHFRRQVRLKDAGIKVLSLFFIDRVDNYVRDDGIIRRLFAGEFDRLKARFPDWQDKDASAVQTAYFATRHTRAGDVYEDSRTGDSDKDREAYDLIMRDKERLLSFDEPTCFIFSHSALREGWDSPNVFQICTLNQTTSEVKKRQEIGRGVRLAVNQTGQRVHDERVNVLTVVANESYESYVARYQSELEQDFAPDEIGPRPANARQRGVARLRKEYTLRPEFKELWDRIKHKTRYAVTIDTDKLLTDVIAELDETDIPLPSITITKAVLEAQGPYDAFETIQVASRRVAPARLGEPLPNLVDVMAHLMANTTPRMQVTRATLLEVFKRTAKKRDALANPHGFAAIAVQIIKRKLVGQLVDGIRYEKIDEWYEMAQFDQEIEGWQDHLVPADRSLYDHVQWESDVERRFVQGLEKRDDVKLYVKLPGWFKVPTPIGDYNPDWAIVVEPRDEHGQPTGEQLLYLVRETKDTTNLDELRLEEARKIHCGKRHFQEALGVSYKVVSDAREVI